MDTNNELEEFFSSIDSNSDLLIPNFRHAFFVYLDFSKSSLQDQGLNFISLLPGINHLKLSQCSLITNSGLTYVSKISSLMSLDISKCRNIGDMGIQNLSSLENLKVLNASSLKISDSTGPLFPSALANLDLSGTHVSQAIISSFSLLLKSNLEYLSLSHSKVTDVKNIDLLDFPSLRRINLDGNSVCYDGSLMKVRDSINSLKSKKIAEIRNGMIEVKFYEDTKSYSPTLSEKLTQQTVSHYFIPYLNQTRPWPMKKEDKVGIRKKSSNESKTMKTPPKKRQLVEINFQDKENFTLDFDLIFPKKVEEMQSMSLVIDTELKQVPNKNVLVLKSVIDITGISPMKCKFQAGIGGNNTPIPIDLSSALDLRNMSPIRKKKKLQDEVQLSNY